MASQGASNGRSQAAGSQFVKFTRQSAQRIAKVVRQVELGNRNQSGVRFDHPINVGVSKNVRLVSFTGTWGVGQISQVTFLKATAQTATAINAYFGVSAGEGFVAKDGTAWYLVGVKLTLQPGYDAAKIQLLGHGSAATSATATLQWYSVTTCTTSTAA